MEASTIVPQTVTIAFDASRKAFLQSVTDKKVD
jgi:hypothetical protein